MKASWWSLPLVFPCAPGAWCLVPGVWSYVPGPSPLGPGGPGAHLCAYFSCGFSCEHHIRTQLHGPAPCKTKRVRPSLTASAWDHRTGFYDVTSCLLSGFGVVFILVYGLSLRYTIRVINSFLLGLCQAGNSLNQARYLAALCL